MLNAAAGDYTQPSKAALPSNLQNEIGRWTKMLARRHLIWQHFWELGGALRQTCFILAKVLESNS